MSQSIKVERGEAVTRIIIDRPEKLNALSASMMATIAEAVECTATPVLVISGNGDKTFCAGADIGEFSTGADALARQETALLHMIAALARSPSLTITLAHGRVMGAGGILTTLSDVVLARDDLSLGFPEIRFGMFPIIVHGVLLERLSPAVASQLCGTGRVLDAERCLDVGMVAQILPSTEFRAEADRAIGWYAERADVFDLMRPAVRVVDADRLESRLHETAPLMLRNYALPGVADRIGAVLRPKSPSANATKQEADR